MNLQTLLDERASDFEDVRSKFHVYDTSLHQYVIDDKAVLDFLQESILQGVRLGLAMGRECIPVEPRGFSEQDITNDVGFRVGFADACRSFLTALEAKEKEI